MKSKLALLIGVLIISFTSYSQTYTKPKEPVFNYLTINPTTGAPSLNWSAPSFDPLYPNPIGYIIYKRIVDQQGNDDYFEIDTVDLNTFQYTDNSASSNGNNARQYYKLASLGVTEPSRQTPHHAQIWLTSTYDSCNAKIDLYWDLYEGWSNADIYQDYTIYIGNNTNWASYTLLSNVNKFNNRYSILNVNENQDYYFYITARRTDKPYTTYSNLHYFNTKMATRPSYMMMDSIIAKNDGIYLYYKIDPATEIRNFKLVRWENSDTSKSIFSAKIIEEFSDPNKTFSIDSNDYWATRTRKYYYKVDAYNGCKSVIKTTNLCNTIIPTVRSSGTNVHLEWDELMIDTARYPDRLGNSVNYTVYRRAYTQNDDVSGIGELTVVASGLTETEFDDDLSPYKGQDPLYKILFKYYIEAFEKNPSSTTVTFVRSRDAITEILPGVTMPTSIAPNSNITNNGRSRNLFEPVISFDASYELTIYNRWGGIIYHGNQGWDGKDSKGEYVKEGSYVYRLIIHTEQSGDVVKNGSLSVVYPK